MSDRKLALQSWNRLSSLPLGAAAWSKMVSARAPYFRSISPRMVELAPGRCIAEMKKRWRIANHLGTVHAIAMCNLAEFAGGLMTEVSVPPGHRWIPKGMTVEYLHKAQTDLRAVCVCDPLPEFGAESFEWPVTVDVQDRGGLTVFRAVIRMWISRKQ
ncbi:hotdog fold domain-containing protein [Panacagrimonas sp.]|uniref:hotdog fold domain-containing protein n=1 Tax=Panacagrimonas sp. TaxID=2480088 RepID=UPI003B518A47